MTRTHGWAPRGERLVAKVPHGKRKMTTFLAALHHDRIEAPCVFDGPINGERFLAHVEQFLAHVEQFLAHVEQFPVPTLKPGDIVILDNPGSHKGKNGERFLPKYSPDLNPIGQVFAKLKGLLRQATARTVDDICDAIGQALKAFSPQECANHFTNAGYAPA